MIRQRLVQRANDFNILLDDVAITHLNFSSEEKKRTIIHAEGEQQSAQMIGDAIKQNPGFVELRRIAVAKEISQMLARSNNRMVLSSDSLLLNLAGGSDAGDAKGKKK